MIALVQQVCLGLTLLSGGSYRVTFDDSLLSARVEADLRIVDDRLRMSTGASDHVPDRWGTFVHGLEVRDEKGEPIPVAHDTVAGWKLQRPTRCAQVRYTVDLSHALGDWPPGNEQGALKVGHSLYTVSKALFLYSPARGTRRVSFTNRLPVAAPWPRSADNSFEARDLDALIVNSLVVGDYSRLTVSRNGFDVNVALLGAAVADSALVRESLQQPIDEFLKLFDTRIEGSYLLTLFYGTEDDGEAFEQSAAFRTPGPLQRSGRILWANTMAHELFHFWNGHGFRGADEATSQWFAEGFTEYYSLRTMVRHRGITVEDFLRAAAQHLAHYEYFRSAGAFREVSVLDAGTRKSTYRFGVYDGGWAVALWLDQLIRRETRGGRSLDDVMRSMPTSYRYDDVVATVSTVIGRPLQAEFDSYVKGLEVLPVQGIARALGLVYSSRAYAAEGYLDLDAAAAADAKALRGAMFGF